ncbi:hypothetical protein ACWGB8_08350 [Kitasatospora sp. NPDC054939]
MPRRLPARSLSGALLAAALVGGLPAAAAPAHAADPRAAGHRTDCDERELGNRIADLRAKAQRLRHEGEHEAARRTEAQADALQRRLDSCRAAEENVAPPLWR